MDARAPQIELLCIPPDDVPTIWAGDIRDMIDAGFAAFDVPMPADILDQFAKGTRLLWVAVNPSGRIIAALSTQLFEMRSGKICKVLECGGEKMREWLHLRAGIEEYAKREGCSRVMIEGRPGWSAVLPDYRVMGVTLEKRI